MSIFSSNVAIKHLEIKQAIGTNAGASVTFPAVTGSDGVARSIYLNKATGFNDTATKVEAKTLLTGTLSTTNGDATVTGTNTLFSTELAVEDIVKINDTSEFLTVLSITDNTHFEATTNAIGNEASSAGHVIAGRSYMAANTALNWDGNGEVKGKPGKALIVTMLLSTTDCHLQASAFTLS